ncbi:MAG: hypothetical protein WC798_00625 [Candidatus Paceibacterota bacterium]
MKISKCDICKNTLDKQHLSLFLSGGGFQEFDLCSKCAEPVMKFLKTKKLIEPSSKK